MMLMAITPGDKKATGKECLYEKVDVIQILSASHCFLRDRGQPTRQPHWCAKTLQFLS